ncbi:MAG: FAD-binding protein [Oscillospiraceae bacterium]|nr:FAD-binding protein [Oscillospiraceae bacterium]
MEENRKSVFPPMEIPENEPGPMDYIENEVNHTQQQRGAYDDCTCAAPPEKIPEDQIVETVDTQVLIVGGGIAGLGAGARCTDLGLRCIVLEKYHGIVARGAHIACTDSPVMRRYGVKIDKKQFARDWMRICGSRVNEDLLWLYLNNCSDAVQWLTDLGGDAVELRLFGGRYKGPDFTEYDGTHYLIQKPESKRYKNRAGAQLMCEILQDRCLEGEGNRILRKTKAQYLEKDSSGRVVSAVALCEDGSYRRFRGSKGVILATGDIGSNPDMVKTFCPLGLVPRRNGYAPQVPNPDVPGTKMGLNTGDGHRMAYWMGGQFETPSWALSLHLLAYSIYVFWFLFVNRDGKRFMNEDTWVQAKAIRCAMQPRGEFAYTVFDSKWFKELGAHIETTGGQFTEPLMMDYGDKWSEDNGIDKQIERYVKFGTCFKADTIEELAEKMEVPVENLKATVARYNELYALGEDLDYGKRSELLTSITQPPFYALKWGPALLNVHGGMLIDTNMHVLDRDSKPIPGLYAIGNVAGGLYGVDYPLLWNGNSHSRAITWARQAVQDIKNTQG